MASRSTPVGVRQWRHAWHASTAVSRVASRITLAVSRVASRSTPAGVASRVTQHAGSVASEQSSKAGPARIQKSKGCVKGRGSMKGQRFAPRKRTREREQGVVEGFAGGAAMGAAAAFGPPGVVTGGLLWTAASERKGGQSQDLDKVYSTRTKAISEPCDPGRKTPALGQAEHRRSCGAHGPAARRAVGEGRR